jgi:CRISPR-associated protein Cas2
MTTSRSRYLVTYDVADDKRRDRVHRTLLDFGDALQFSVFLCDLNERERIDLRGRLGDTIHHRDDQVLVVRLGPVDRDAREIMESVGRAFLVPTRVVVV